MFMADTVILATSRERCMEKVNILLEFCASSKMTINESKTKFRALNCPEVDKQPLLGEDDTGVTVIEHCTSYTYLGS